MFIQLAYADFLFFSMALLPEFMTVSTVLSFTFTITPLAMFIQLAYAIFLFYSMAL